MVGAPRSGPGGERSRAGHGGVAAPAMVGAVIAAALALVVAIVLFQALGDERDGSGRRSPGPAEVGAVEVVLAAGDIAGCNARSDDAVAELVDDQTPGLFLMLGDGAYPNGTLAEYQQCFDPLWGRYKDRTRPATGNHEYLTPGANGYFSYFGSAAAPPHGYYSFPIGEYWHAIVLNSNCEHVEGGCEPGSPQEQWLRGELRAHADKNVLAYWHEPRFSTGEHGNSWRVKPFWDALHEAGADLVLAGHDHDYERFAPQDTSGKPDPAGIRQFVVGTGGGGLRSFDKEPSPATEVRNAESHGLLRLELGRVAYRWRFVATPDTTFRDEGSAWINGMAPVAP